MGDFVIDPQGSLSQTRSVSTMSIVTRFAPSPTGFLHIGGARTALFNWLYARHHGGRYLLRIEDTDRARSTAGRDPGDLRRPELARSGGRRAAGVPVPADRASRRGGAGAAGPRRRLSLLLHAGGARGDAGAARAEGRTTGYDGRCRDLGPAEAPPGVAPVIRLKAPRHGETVIEDRVQGTVRFANEQLDDMVLLRSDGTPTYMLSVVVDDHDMAITHIIRGDDHLVNAARQTQLYRALDWPVPTFAHIPLIHGADGAKLSKRHGALAVDAYREMGFLPEAMRNYLLRLGWSHGDDEIIPTEQAIAWFDLDAVGRGAARFDMARLTRSMPTTCGRCPTRSSRAWWRRAWRRAACGSTSRRARGSKPGWRVSSRGPSTLAELAERARFYVASGRWPSMTRQRSCWTRGPGSGWPRLAAALGESAAGTSLSSRRRCAPRPRRRAPSSARSRNRCGQR